MNRKTSLRMRREHMGESIGSRAVAGELVAWRDGMHPVQGSPAPFVKDVHYRTTASVRLKSRYNRAMNLWQPTGGMVISYTVRDDHHLLRADQRRSEAHLKPNATVEQVSRALHRAMHHWAELDDLRARLEGLYERIEKIADKDFTAQAQAHASANGLPLAYCDMKPDDIQAWHQWLDGRGDPA